MKGTGVPRLVIRRQGAGCYEHTHGHSPGPNRQPYPYPYPNTVSRTEVWPTRR